MSSKSDMDTRKIMEDKTKKNAGGLASTRNNTGTPTKQTCNMPAMATPMYRLSAYSSDMAGALKAWILARRTAARLWILHCHVSSMSQKNQSRLFGFVASVAGQAVSSIEEESH